MFSPVARDIGLMQARGQIRGSSIVGFAKGHMHAVGGQAPADGVTAKTDGELVWSQGTALKLTMGHHCKNNKCAKECVAWTNVRWQMWMSWQLLSPIVESKSQSKS